MKKDFAIFLILIFFVLGVPSLVFAQDVVKTPVTINARILPTIWYSTLSVKEGDSVKIYAGIQNNSGTDFSGVATFYVDDKESSHVSYFSKAGGLNEVSTNWITSGGSHNVQVKISTSLLTGKILVSYDSDKSNIDITPKVVVPLSDAVKEKVLDTASNVTSNVDDLANNLADKIDSHKKPISARQGLAESSVNKKTGSVLGAETGPANVMNSIIKNIKNYSPFDFLYNFFLTIVSFLVRNWKWSLGGLILLFLFFKFFR